MTATTRTAALAHRAVCQSCDWSTGAGTWAALDKAAERHARTGHAVTALTVPAGS